ncbi:MAG: hypothetical protein JO108_18715 [Acidobacteriaceae bacterium]|nr:hypothetical protein [Acidobacteriaceae bacterium]
MSFGIYDKQDCCWLGNDAGPIVHDERWLALAALTVVCEQTDLHPSRLEVREYDGTGTRLKDELPTDAICWVPVLREHLERHTNRYRTRI